MNRAFQHIIKLILYPTIIGFALLYADPSATAQFSIGPGGYVTVTPGGSLYIDTDLHIKSVAGASGALADQNPAGDIEITGDITVDRYLTADEWHNVSSPVSDENTSVFTGTDLVFWYDESMIWNDWNFGWVWYSGATGGPLIEFRGYDVLFETSPVTVVYEAGGAEILNTGTYNINVSNTDPAPNPYEIPSHKGWNLLGNPYPSPVDWLATGWDKSDINDAKYIWDDLNDVYTIYVGGGSPYGLNGGTRFIPSNQGFWVQAVTSGSVGIGNSTRLGSMTATPDYYKLDPVDYPLIGIFTTGNGKRDEVALRFIEGTSAQFDKDYDATKLFSYIEDVPQLSLRFGKQIFALNTLPAVVSNMDIPLDFHCGVSGLCSINLSPTTLIDPSIQVYLKDDMENIIIDLVKDSSYLFYHHPSDSEKRFHLLINPSEEILHNIDPHSYFTVYGLHNQVTILKSTAEEMQGEVVVFNMLGQAVRKAELKNNDKITMNLLGSDMYYIVSIRTKLYLLNYKVLIHN